MLQVGPLCHHLSREILLGRKEMTCVKRGQCRFAMLACGQKGSVVRLERHAASGGTLACSGQVGIRFWLIVTFIGRQFALCDVNKHLPQNGQAQVAEREARR